MIETLLIVLVSLIGLLIFEARLSTLKKNILNTKDIKQQEINRLKLVIRNDPDNVPAKVKLSSLMTADTVKFYTKTKIISHEDTRVTINHTSIIPGSVLVFINGIHQNLGTDYTFEYGDVVFDSGYHKLMPSSHSDDRVVVVYAYLDFGDYF